MDQPRDGGSGPNEARVVRQAARSPADHGRPGGDLARGDVALQPERRARRDGAVLVDPGQLGLERAGDALALRAVARPDADDAAAGAAVARRGPVLHQFDRGGLARGLDDRQHRARRGLAQDPRAGGHAPQHGGRVERAGQSLDPDRAAADQLRAAGDRLLDERLERREVLGRAQRPDLRLLARGVADLQPPRALAQQSEQRLGDRRHAHEAPGGGRMTPARGERGPQRGRGDLLDRRALEHQQRALGLRPLERDDPRARVRQRGPRRVAVHDGQQLARDPGPQQRGAQPLAGERRGGGEHDAVAGQQRGGHLQRGLGPRASRPTRARRPRRAAPARRRRGGRPAAARGGRAGGRPARRARRRRGRSAPRRPAAARRAPPPCAGGRSRAPAAAPARRGRRASAAPPGARSAPARGRAPRPTRAAPRRRGRRRRARPRRSPARPRRAARRSRGSGPRAASGGGYAARRARERSTSTRAEHVAQAGREALVDHEHVRGLGAEVDRADAGQHLAAVERGERAQHVPARGVEREQPPHVELVGGQAAGLQQPRSPRRGRTARRGAGARAARPGPGRCAAAGRSLSGPCPIHDSGPG